MHSKLVWSFLSVVALATGGLITGCDSDAKIAKSGVGESCDSSADCNEGLKCLEGACYKGSTGTGGGGNEGGEGTGTGGNVIGPKPPVLGGEGESCTKRADCEDGLGCFNERCTKETAGEGGEGNIPGVKLGQIGETCQTSADCEGELSCVPGGAGSDAPYGYLGVCSKPTGTLKSTGKMCGAECLEAADCCELPLQVHLPFGAEVAGTSSVYGTGANSCAELASLLGTTDCDGNTLTAVQKARCFAQAAYCDCGKNTWSCEAGRCIFGDACTGDGAVPGGCPLYTRSGATATTPTTCNSDGACAPEPVEVTVCKKDADCDDGFTADTAENCVEGECTCFKATGGCYRKCDNTLDCSPGFMCDTDTSVCVTAPGCDTNEQCAVKMGSDRYSCVDNICQFTCRTDYDCNGGEYYGMETPICGPDNICHPIGCSADDDCSITVGTNKPVRMFCTEPAEGPGIADAHSAITD